ncbi:WhiB family transcriptional regulator [Ornithinimicrobium sufpigmenti]|uniref:WhiB family transcriptional regulator n=1 Tax=Ornithinimicrobium sufpigmenti TaxID=2508882 RepID=UPI001036A0F2
MTIAPHRTDDQHRQRQEGPDVDTLVAQNAPALTTLLGGGPARTGLPCQEHPADLWFAELPHEVEEAKALCQACPLRQDCLAGALERREPWGVWGGQLVLQGAVVPRKRPRGRPRKDEVAA